MVCIAYQRKQFSDLYVLSLYGLYMVCIAYQAYCIAYQVYQAYQELSHLYVLSLYGHTSEVCSAYKVSDCSVQHSHSGHSL